ncbi:MOSC domain-containing protein [Rhexocercosporidium sp. MPI-PUGE-AT-0058]|nr:MOSC domain-containing protein [Rhexocercosporidium sp. MPI-PUGE-AT-0058]
MAPIIPPNLDAPWHKDTVLQLRTSKMKPMHNLSISTGIYKQPRTTRVFCTSTGLESDEHDLTFHGGVDKAVHQYYPGHYPSWRTEYPSASNFELGGFGENIVSEHMNERNVCIGDIIRIGEVLLQVSLPRQPCFKLNHRFGLKNFASQTWKKSRTGWYYRVLEEGWMGVGDSIELVERKYENWTIERVQEYLHRDKGNLEMLMQLEQIPEFGNECKNAFKHMISTLRLAEAEKNKPKEPEKWDEYTLLSKKAETSRISSFVFSKPGKDEDKELDPGSFVRLKLPNGLLRSYSIVSGTRSEFMLGVALDEHSRGGSKYLHENLYEGDTILVGKITESVPIKAQFSNHIFIAGGIGITAFLGHMDIYDKIGFNYMLHFAVRSGEEVPFTERIEEARVKGRVVLYEKAKGERMDIEGILKERVWGSCVYTCGPRRMIEGVEKAVEKLGMVEDEVHYEAFQADVGGDPFVVEVVTEGEGEGEGKEGRVIDVPGDMTLLQCIREAGLEIDSSCEVGNCGACRVTVKEGQVEHRGSALSKEDKEEGGMLSCVSRGMGRLKIEW